MNLRPYQIAARDAVHAAWETVSRTLLVLPTGTGKTVVFSHIAADVVEHGGRVLILAHRGELLQQAADKLQRATGLVAAVEKAEDTAHDTLHRVTVGSVQTLMRPSRRERFADDYYAAIIVDEAHHALADSYQSVLSHWPEAKILGVTATADRNDRRNLGTYFESLAYEYSLPQAIRDGFLAPIRALSIPLPIDLRNVRVSAGEFNAADLGDALAPYLSRIAHELRAHAGDRKTLVFVPLIATAQRFAELLQAEGFAAKWVSGDDPERADKLAWYASAGPGAVLVNSMLLTEGYDDPRTDCVVCLRPTKSRPLYAQIVGRGTRLCVGKRDLLLLDFLWMTDRHELVRPAHLIASSDAEARVMTRMSEEAGADGMELDDAAVETAGKEVVAEREKALADELAKQRAKQRKLVDPLQYAVSINAADLSDYAPSFGWEAGPATEAQRAALEAAGLSPDVANAGMASRLLDRVAARKAGGFATPKQIRLLERYGFRKVGEMMFHEATRIVGRLSANGWRITPDLQARIRAQGAA